MVNGKLNYDFTALDNLMDRLWENKLIPGKGSSLPAQLGVFVHPYCTIIGIFLESFFRAGFDKRFHCLPICFYIMSQCEQNDIIAIKTTLLVLYCL